MSPRPNLAHLFDFADLCIYVPVSKIFTSSRITTTLSPTGLPSVSPSDFPVRLGGRSDWVAGQTGWPVRLGG